MELMFFIFILFVSYSPLLLILVFIVYLFFVVIYLVFVMNSYFYSYLVFLLFISGLMILFMYLCSVVLNEKLIFQKETLYFVFLAVWIFDLGVSEVVYNLSFNFFFFEFYNLVKFFIYSYNLFSVFFILYLVFCLIVVYEFIKTHKGPLRSMT